MNNTSSKVIPVMPNTQPVVLIVDDERGSLAIMNAALRAYCCVRIASNGTQALQAISTPPSPDLILLDIMMPDMDGYAVLSALRQTEVGRDVPVIFVTALEDELNEQRCLEVGAVDFLRKPLRPTSVLARVKHHLELKSARDALTDQNHQLEARVTERTAALHVALNAAEGAHSALKKTYFSTLQAISAVAEMRGGGLGEHSRRVADLARQVAQRMMLDDASIQDIFVAALLHDIGMIGYPDEMLLKPVNAMSAAHLSLYYNHTTAGALALRNVADLAGIAEIIHAHHEHYDGQGFPAGKCGLEIPLGARIIGAVSDYDHLCHGKLTGRPLTAKQASEYLYEARGKRYDPHVVDHLIAISAEKFRFEIDEIALPPGRLHDGMQLTRAISHPDGYLLLAKGTKLTRSIIDQLIVVDRQIGGKMTMWVSCEQSTTHPTKSRQKE